MKIAIITITEGANYGNRLQNYALQRILETTGSQAETIYMLRKDECSLPLYMKAKIKRHIKNAIGYHTQKLYLKRKNIFHIFNQKHIQFSDWKICSDKVPRGLAAKFDLFICGSDQNWNTNVTSVHDNLCAFLASFAPREKKISYAASFGTADIPEQYQETYRRLLPEFRAISVREHTGKDIVARICNREAMVVLDPTMLLQADDWRKLEKKPNYPCGKFVVTYILSKHTPEVLAYTERVKEHFGAERVIHLSIEFLNDEQIAVPEHYLTDPSEFLWLIEHAECVLTDSFHATVFSLLFHKPFMVFQRKMVEQGNDMSSRLTTLLSYFGLEQFCDEIDHPSKLPEPYDGTRIDTVLAEKRKESLRFLQENL